MNILITLKNLSITEFLVKALKEEFSSHSFYVCGKYSVAHKSIVPSEIIRSYVAGFERGFNLKNNLG